MPNANFIKAVEIWVPNAHRTKLTLKTGHYGELDYFERISRGMQFAYDEGLPGKCWSSGQPIVLKQLSDSYFRRGDAAMTSELDCAIAIPTYDGADLRAVMVFLCGHDGHRIGALELWHAREGEPQMGLHEGYFGAAEKFEFTSRNTQFSRKVGLPGLVWDSGMPMIMDDLGRSAQFLRSGSAEKVGINRGVAIPCHARPGTGSWVVTFLSARNSPIARGFEIWLPNEATGLFRLAEAYHEEDAEYSEDMPKRQHPLDVGPLGEARVTRLPVIAQIETGPAESDDEDAPTSTILVMPVLKHGTVAANLVAYLG